MVRIALLSMLVAFTGLPAAAGPIFLTGHDPDFHSQDSAGAGNLLKAGLDFVTGNTTSNMTDKFLWVESRIAPPSGHRVGEDGLGTLGLSLGTHYDRANGSELPGVDFSSYTALVIASSFGGLLTRAELDALIGRKSDIASFVNAGGGLMALAECDDCGADLLGVNPNLFGYLPLSGIIPTGVSGPFTVTAEGAAPPFNLTNADVNDPTHNAFNPATIPGFLKILDTEPDGDAVTLAGVVRVRDDVIVSVPVPATAALLLGGLALLGLRRVKGSA